MVTVHQIGVTTQDLNLDRLSLTLGQIDITSGIVHRFRVADGVQMSNGHVMLTRRVVLSELLTAEVLAHFWLPQYSSGVWLP